MSNNFSDNPNPLVTQDILKRNLLEKDPFFLVDVGASGGIGNPWHHLEDSLRAIAIDPLTTECKRLQEKETRPMVKFVDAFAVAENPKDQIQSISQRMCDFYARSSSEEASRKKSYNFIKENFNSGAELVYSETKTSLNNLLEGEVANVNFLKVDTDGYDLSVLKGANKVLNNHNCIATMVECQFLGEKGIQANVFSNIERYLADFGFYVYNMDLNNYSRHHLPSKFKYNIFAQTQRGQVTWADVLFIKDPLEDKNLNLNLAYKYLIVFELFNLQDCAAELLVERRDLFDENQRLKHLDYLASQYYNSKATYHQALNNYNKNPEFFFPRNYTYDVFNKIGKKVTASIINSTAQYVPRSIKDKVKSFMNITAHKS